MSPADRTILVTEATGQQGGASARCLLADGWHVRALVRDPSSRAATRLAMAGAELVIGDMDDRDSVDAAVRGVHRVFSVQPAFIAPDFAENELQRGLSVADAAEAGGVRHLVYASVASADRATGIPHWEIKWEIEQHIRALGIPTTVLRPVMFMENIADPTHGVNGTDPLVPTIPRDVSVQLIALADIGAFAALAFADPDRFLGRTIELAGDELRVDQILAATGRATGHDVATAAPARRVPSKMMPSFCGWQADIPALRRIHPGLLDFDTWLMRNGKALLEQHFHETGAR
ncbi:NmrA/HSCARG family protein [Pseudonocardia sp. CA-142604]|uniref:NmrA/HSCARG family protein n=1 Tax=Pseudonocardia sp. CA-142604 TaxID=3240024 RepID=UPI003D91359B